MDERDTARQTRRGFGIAATVPFNVIQAAGQTAESLGYDSFWVNDIPGGDGLAALATVASVTKTIRLSVGVLGMSRYTPEAIAARVRDLGLPLDRLVLGVGSGATGPGSLERVQEGIRGLKAEVECPVVVAATGPRMARLGGREADGVLFNWVTPAYAKVSADWVAEGAAEAGRETPALLAYVRTALGQAGAARLAEEAARYSAMPGYAAHAARMGADLLDTTVIAETADAVQTGLQRFDGVLDEAIVRAITGRDTVEDVLALVQAAAPGRSRMSPQEELTV